MRVEVQEWGNSAAIRIPTPALKDAGMHMGQCLELHVEAGRLVLQSAAEHLEDLLARMTLENVHSLVLEGASIGNEAW